MEFKVDILKKTNTDINICPYYYGSGKLKAMQSVANYTGSTRGKDVQVKCRHCNGSGSIK